MCNVTILTVIKLFPVSGTEGISLPPRLAILLSGVRHLSSNHFCMPDHMYRVN